MKKKMSVALATWLTAEADGPAATRLRRRGALEWLDTCAQRELAYGFGTMLEGGGRGSGARSSCSRTWSTAFR